MKKSPEAAAQAGEILGQPYTPPGRDVVFDVPAYDDIADLQVLFKRFANTVSGSDESGGKVVEKTAAFDVLKADMGTTFLCTWPTVNAATLLAAITPTDGKKVSFIQLGLGAVQIKSTGDPVKGLLQTPGQYQGIQAIYSEKTWWCVPFGGSGGGGSGTVPIFNVSADTTLKALYIGGLLAVNVGDGKDKTVTVPKDDGTIAIGSVIVVTNVGPLSVPKILIVGATDVVVQDRALSTVLRWRSAALVKRDANLWLINAGGGGGGGTGTVPTPPAITSSSAAPAGASLVWTAPKDDGGHSVSSYVAEISTNGTTFSVGGVFSALLRTATITNLTPGTKYSIRLRAENSQGVSDPSNVVQVTPTAPFNNATGGTITEVPNYNGTGQKWRVHTFANSGTFTVVQQVTPFRVLIAGPGGAGASVSGGRGGQGGGGGAVLDTTTTMPVADYTVGNNSINGLSAAGGQDSDIWNNGDKGGFSGNGNPPGRRDPDLGWNAGGGGGAGGPGGISDGGAGGPGGPAVGTIISGFNQSFGRGGSGGAQANGLNGQASIVIVAYRIA